MRRTELSKCLMALILVPVLAACSEDGNGKGTGGAKKAEAIPSSGTSVELALTGYNYTNREIGNFSVNSTGGGNVHVSSPTSGGGGSACCVAYTVGAKKWRVLVRWQTDACSYNNEIYSNGERGFEVYHYFKETELDVHPAVADRPQNLEVHFYQDGHLEAAITEEESVPRLKLPKEREDKSPYRKCPNDERPYG
jgi:hypothetical protein